MMLLNRRSIALYSAAFFNVLHERKHSPQAREEDVQLAPTKVLSSSTSKNIIGPKKIHNAVEWICGLTPESFREGVRRSGGNFLYLGENLTTQDNGSITIRQPCRGEKLTTKNNGSVTNRQTLLLPQQSNDDQNLDHVIAGWILNPKPDLLLPGTYGDRRSLEYFECFETRLSAMPSSRSDTSSRSPTYLAKPSNGHIGTSDPNQASQWGNVVSVWPLGNELSYVWLKDRTEFFPPNTDVSCDKFDDKLVINQDLAYALQSKREVLFCSWFENSPISLSLPTGSWAFLTVPREHDGVLLESLQRVEYGLRPVSALC
jgi:hypothetical protein